MLLPVRLLVLASDVGSQIVRALVIIAVLVPLVVVISSLAARSRWPLVLLLVRLVRVPVLRTTFPLVTFSSAPVFTSVTVYW